MSQETKLRAAGLYSQPSLIGEDIPDGALVTADNVVIRREGILEQRRGVSAYATATANRITSYQDRLITHTSTGTLNYDNGAGSFTAISGSYPPPSATTAKTRFAQAAQDLFLTTSTGVYRMDSYSATPALAGAIKATGFDRDQRVYTSAAGTMSLTSNVVTVNTSAAHGFYVGQVVTMTSATEGAHYLAGNHTVVSVPSSTSFTYAETAGDDAGNANTHTWGPATLATSGGFLADGNQVAYQAVFNCPDTNNTEKPGAASPRIVISNTTGTNGWVTAEAKNVVVRVMVPSGVTVSHSIRLYRSGQGTVEPSMEVQLVYEAFVKTTEIAQGWVDITDVTPDAMRGASGYFVPSQETMARNNERPPLAKDIAVFGGSMHFVNTTALHRQRINLLGLGTTGLQDGDVFTIEVSNVAVNYTAKTTPTDTKHFQVASSSTGANIRNAALNLAAAINRNASSPVAAYYVSNADDAPGQLLLENKALGAAAFTVYMSGTGATNGLRTAWSPVLNLNNFDADLSRTSNVVTATVTPAVPIHIIVGERVENNDPSGTFGAGPHTITSVAANRLSFTYTETAANDTVAGRGFNLATLNSSTAQATPSRVAHSKTNLFEAVPLLNYTDIGGKESEILRIIALRDSMFAFKEDGLYRGTGSNGSFSWALFDPTVVLIAPDSAVTLGNQIYAWTTQGVVAVSDTGSEIVSRPIEKTLLALQTADLAAVQQVTFALGYESEHTYELRTISAAAETTCTQAFIFNTVTRTWVRDTITTKCGVIHPTDDKRYLGGATQILKERKARTYADYSDVDIALGTFEAGGTAISAIASTTGVSVGDIFVEDSSGYAARITAVPSGTTLTVEDNPGFSPIGLAATIKTRIASTIQWAPITGGNPAQSKLWRETTFLMGNAHFPSATVSHSTELVPTFEDSVIDGEVTAAQWALANTAWDGTERPFNLRLAVPQEMRRSTRLNLKFALSGAWTAWNISGVSVVFEPGSTKVAR